MASDTVSHSSSPTVDGVEFYEVSWAVRIMMRLIPPVNKTPFDASAVGRLYCCC